MYYLSNVCFFYHYLLIISQEIGVPVKCKIDFMLKWKTKKSTQTTHTIETQCSFDKKNNLLQVHFIILYTILGVVKKPLPPQRCNARFARFSPSPSLPGTIRTPPSTYTWSLCMYGRPRRRRRRRVLLASCAAVTVLYFGGDAVPCDFIFINIARRAHTTTAHESRRAHTHSGENSGHANGGGGDPRAFSGTRRRVLLRDSRWERKTKSKPYIGNTRLNAAAIRRHTRFPGRCPPSARPA